MFRFFTPIILLQAFCLYHAYKRNETQKWFWIILIFPFIGSLIYVYHTFYSRENIEGLKEEVKSNLITNYKLEKLEKALLFSDSISNKLALADEHLNCGNYDRAEFLYESCLKGIYKDDSDLLMKLVKLNYLKKEYNKVIEYGNRISEKTLFNKSEEKVALAWANFYTGNSATALDLFNEMDTRFSNYFQRLEFAKYLVKNNEQESANEKLTTLIHEIESMNSYEKKLNRKIYRQIRAYKSELIK